MPSLRRSLRAAHHATRRSVLRTLLLTGLASLPLAACYQDPNEQIEAMQATIDLQDTLNELGMRTTELQFTLDSLRSIVARQDSTIYRLANLAGIPYPR
jgi:hypothetical protein